MRATIPLRGCAGSSNSIAAVDGRSITSVWQRSIETVENVKFHDKITTWKREVFRRNAHSRSLTEIPVCPHIQTLGPCAVWCCRDSELRVVKTKDHLGLTIDVNMPVVTDIRIEAFSQELTGSCQSCKTNS